MAVGGKLVGDHILLATLTTPSEYLVCLHCFLLSKCSLTVGFTAIRSVRMCHYIEFNEENLFRSSPTTAYSLASHYCRVLEADRRVEMPKGCITSSHKSFGQGRAVSVCDIRPGRVYRTICI